MPELELGSSQPSYILGVVPLQDNPTTMLIGQLGCRSTVHDIITISTVVPAPLPTPTSATTQTVPYDVGVYHGWLPLSHSSRCRFCVLGACSRIEPEFRDIRMHGLRGEETTVVKWEERQLYRKEQEGYSFGTHGCGYYCITPVEHRSVRSWRYVQPVGVGVGI